MDNLNTIISIIAGSFTIIGGIYAFIKWLNQPKQATYSTQTSKTSQQVTLKEPIEGPSQRGGASFISVLVRILILLAIGAFLIFIGTIGRYFFHFPEVALSILAIVCILISFRFR